jgi:hypothetical protein
MVTTGCMGIGARTWANCKRDKSVVFLNKKPSVIVYTKALLVQPEARPSCLTGCFITVSSTALRDVLRSPPVFLPGETNKLHRARSFLRNWYLLDWSRNSLPFMEPEESWPCSQKSGTGSHWASLSSGLLSSGTPAKHFVGISHLIHAWCAHIILLDLLFVVGIPWRLRGFLLFEWR